MRQVLRRALVAAAAGSVLLTGCSGTVTGVASPGADVGTDVTAAEFPITARGRRPGRPGRPQRDHRPVLLLAGRLPAGLRRRLPGAAGRGLQRRPREPGPVGLPRRHPSPGSRTPTWATSP